MNTLSQHRVMSRSLLRSCQWRFASLQPARTFATVLGSQSIEVKPIAGSVGAEVHGVDLRSLDDDKTKQIRNAFLAHKVIFFHDQHLGAEDYLAFASRIGQPSKYPFVSGIEGHPEITHVLKREHEKNNFGGIWHSDTVYLEQPLMGTMLLARELPPRAPNSARVHLPL